MLEIRARLGRGVVAARIDDRLRLPFELRQKSRLRATLESGNEAAIALARGEWLRGGDLLVAQGGEVVEVVADAEDLLHVECATPEALARVAYHLGNRHVALQAGPGWVRIAFDAVLQKLVTGLSAKASRLQAPFEPEAGAYAPHHRHDNVSHGARIHEFPSRS
jgi:urease accessory protein